MKIRTPHLSRLAFTFCSLAVGFSLLLNSRLVGADAVPLYEHVRYFGDSANDGIDPTLSFPDYPNFFRLNQLGYGGVPLTRGVSGALYGTTRSGGTYGYGTVYRLDTDGTYSTLHHFNYTGAGLFGLNPCGVIEGVDGALYGTTSFGGAMDAGTIFKLDGTGYHTLWEFGALAANDGANPYAPLLHASDGMLYGTTFGGGESGQGTIFKINPVANTYTSLTNFAAVTNVVVTNEVGFVFGLIPRIVDFNGRGPVAGLVEVNGALYGTTSHGGGGGLLVLNAVPQFGTIFRLNRDGSGLTTLHSFFFGDPYDGNKNLALGGEVKSLTALVLGDDGALYGTARYSPAASVGGNFDFEGVLFKLEPNGTFTELFAGSAPSGLMKASDGNLYSPQLAISTDGTVSFLNYFTSLSESASALTQGANGALYGTGLLWNEAGVSGGEIYNLKISSIYKLNPASVPAGGAEFSLAVSGFFGGSSLQGATVLWNGSPRPTTVTGKAKLEATIPASDLVSADEIKTAMVTVLMADGRVSNPLLFTITSPLVGVVASTLVGAEQSVSISTPNVTNALDQPGEAAIAASVNNTGEANPITVSAATFVDNPTTSPLIDVGGGYVDLKVVGADEQDSATANFFYPSSVTGVAEDALVLKYYNVSAQRWDPVISSGPSDPSKDTSDDQEGTVSGGRFGVWFDSTSTPKITELSGTVFSMAGLDTTAPTIACPANITLGCSVNPLVAATYSATASDDSDPTPAVTCSPPSGSGFAIGTTTVTCTARDASGNQSSCSFTVTRAPVGFSGFHAPIGGADATGGSFASPLRTFKLNSTIPIKFTLACGGSPLLTGVHTLQAIKYSDETTAGTAIDATPTEGATSGNQFRRAGSEWHFNLDTRATVLKAGIWLLRTTLSDGSQHSAWIQIK
jgi:uncharacterized repeat protein (TIGR03803 family)